MVWGDYENQLGVVEQVVVDVVVGWYVVGGVDGQIGLVGGQCILDVVEYFIEQVNLCVVIVSVEVFDGWVEVFGWDDYVDGNV